ncbi:GSCOCG00000851001-RA-CDS, partial [Cotesia congregata]
KILTPSEIKTIYYASVHQKFVDDIKNNGNISLLYVSYDSIFVTSSQKIVDNTISRSSGSPLVCRRHPQDPFQLTGILIDTLDNFPAYFAINEIWTKQKLVFLNSLK